MRTVPLKQIMQGASSLLGAELFAPGSPDFSGAIESINTWLPVGWSYDWWPDLMRTERRAYRPTWASGTTYAGGTEVFFATDELYYTANLTPNNPAAGQSPATAPTRWTALTSFARYVAYDQAGLTPIGEVRRVCRNDPELQPQAPGELRFDVTRRGIVPDRRAGAQVYVEFRLQPPQLSAVDYAAGTAYAAGDGCFDPTTWACYTAVAATTGNAPGNPTYWALVDLPFFLAAYLQRAVYADRLTADGAADKAGDELARAFNFLTQAQDNSFGQQGQIESVRAVTY